MYNLRQTMESKGDVKNLAAYMMYFLKNYQAAEHFLIRYQREIHSLALFPLAYRSIHLTYQGYVIRIKPFSSYNIFYVADTELYQVTILRVLKNRQNWKDILHQEDKYSF